MPDPTTTDPDKYTVVFENHRVRVLEYRDEPGSRTSPHVHPDSVMVTLSAFDRRLIAENGEAREVRRSRRHRFGGSTPRQQRENTGTTPTHVLFVELKEPAPASGDARSAQSTASRAGR